jgi:hypothetical protein
MPWLECSKSMPFTLFVSWKSGIWSISCCGPDFIQQFCFIFASRQSRVLEFDIASSEAVWNKSKVLMNWDPLLDEGSSNVSRSSSGRLMRIATTPTLTYGWLSTDYNFKGSVDINIILVAENCVRKRFILSREMSNDLGSKSQVEFMKSSEHRTSTTKVVSYFSEFHKHHYVRTSSQIAVWQNNSCLMFNPHFASRQYIDVLRIKETGNP